MSSSRPTSPAPTPAYISAFATTSPTASPRPSRSHTPQLTALFSSARLHSQPSSFETQPESKPQTPRPQSVKLPACLQARDSDSEEDITPTNHGVINMNQSLFNLLAVTGQEPGSQNAEGSSDDDEADPKVPMRKMAQTTILSPADKHNKSRLHNHRRRLSGLGSSRLLRPLRRSSSSKTATEKDIIIRDVTAKVVEVAEEATESAESKDIEQTEEEVDKELAPVMSTILDGQKEMAARSSFEFDREENKASSLALRLKEIFDFEEPEKVVSEFPCWLLKSVLLQGFMYVTSNHICFYAYLPQKTNKIVKAGYLGKAGRRNPKYHRYHFRLKGSQLTYHENAADQYFQTGQIDLSYAASAMVMDREKNKDGLLFNLKLPERTYHFKADSAESAKDWVRALQKVIFRSHNDGDSVKISLPIGNVIDVEATNILDFAETVKIRVWDNEDTFAIDEYFFSFFSESEEALAVLKLASEKALQCKKPHQQKIPADHKSRSTTPNTMSMNDHVKDTMSPRSSMDGHRPTFFGGPARQSHSRNVSQSSALSAGLSAPPVGRRIISQGSMATTVDLQASTESYGQCMSMDDSSMAMLSSMDEVSAVQSPNASQILHGSDVFKNPQTGSPLESPARPSKGKSSGNDPVHNRPSSSNGPEEGVAQSKAGTFPLSAGGFAGYLGRTGRKMSSLLATESMGYVEKVSGMWKGGRTYYAVDGEIKEGAPQNVPKELNNEKVKSSNERFQAHFGLPPTESLRATYFCHMMRVIPLYGKIYIGDKTFCFRSLLPGARSKLILPLKDIETVDKEKGFRFGYSGLVVVIRGHEELFFEFSAADGRDDCHQYLDSLIGLNRYQDTPSDGQNEDDDLTLSQAKAALAERDALRAEQILREKFLIESGGHTVMLDEQTNEVDNLVQKHKKSASIPPLASLVPKEPLRIICLTIGSRGDVQPYIALCKGLKAVGHNPKIVTHAEFGPWVQKHGIDFAAVGGDPAELMRLCIDNGMFTLTFLREATSLFRGWLDNLLASAWEGCQDADLLIESPSAMAGIHIAEALGVPYFRAFTMPWTRTRAYPHAFAVPEHKMGGAYNYMTYVMFDNIFWQGIAAQVNRWRASHLSLPPTNLDKMQAAKVPFLYNFSPSVVAPPLDFSDWIRVTGYWFLDEGAGDWEPPEELLAFINKARADDKKIVYVGFGSILVNDPGRMTEEVIDAIRRADVRCILSKGWSERKTDTQNKRVEVIDDGKTPEPEIPDFIHVIKSAPHDWLFRQIDAAAHHGGSGTTGASLRAGIPTIIRPFFGDQFFFGSRVEDIGVGLCLKKWGATSFGVALWRATTDQNMIERARVLGERIRKEDGVGNAISALWRDLEYSQGLVKQKKGEKVAKEGEGEGWTWVGEGEMDPEVVVARLSV